MLLLRFRKIRIVRAASVDRVVCASGRKTPSGHKDTSQQAKTRARDEEASAEEHELREEFWRVVHPP